MPLPWPELLAVAGALAWATPAAAQHGREIGVQAMATASDPVLGAAGVYAGLRASTRTRVSVALGAGASSGELAWRGEVLGHFLLSPAKRRGPGFYVAGGLAGVGGPVDRGYLVLSLGLEDRPGGPSGWAVEAGVGGGARLGLGYRWRWLRAPGAP